MITPLAGESLLISWMRYIFDVQLTRTIGLLIFLFILFIRTKDSFHLFFLFLMDVFFIFDDHVNL